MPEEQENILQRCSMIQSEGLAHYLNENKAYSHRSLYCPVGWLWTLHAKQFSR